MSQSTRSTRQHVRGEARHSRGAWPPVPAIIIPTPRVFSEFVKTQHC